MKLLSVAVPFYNSQAYMRNCVDSLLEGGDLVEILIVDDGSKDDTGKIADEYAARYPNIVKAIHQENGGHGEAVNTGIRNATGLYFKVVDSDDWVNAEAFHAILDKLQEIMGGPQVLDMMISNFVYEKQGAKRKKVMRYTKYMPVNYSRALQPITISSKSPPRYTFCKLKMRMESDISPWIPSYLQKSALQSFSPLLRLL